MTRDAQEQRQRDLLDLCQVQYRGGDNPTFINARCKLHTDHSGFHRTWRGSQGTGEGRTGLRYMEWE